MNRHSFILTVLTIEAFLILQINATFLKWKSQKKEKLIDYIKGKSQYNAMPYDSNSKPYAVPIFQPIPIPLNQPYHEPTPYSSLQIGGFPDAFNVPDPLQGALSDPQIFTVPIRKFKHRKHKLNEYFISQPPSDGYDETSELENGAADSLQQHFPSTDYHGISGGYECSFNPDKRI